MLIAHIADVHIKGLSRHSEHRQVFEDFIQQCSALNVDHVFIAGDIFHTKTTGISPEYIDLLTWWLTKLSAVTKVHIILGNHDGNLVNLSRQDAVTPIVQAIGSDAISLYKKSGVYEFSPGYTWCVFSLFDEEGWDAVAPVDGKVNIACYHGAVSSAKTETGWDISEGFPLEKFEPFQFAFLGDIHLKQYLAFRRIADGSCKPWVAYPGSCIQQNYAEELEHGFLLWDIRSADDFDVEFKPLINPAPFYTFVWDGSLSDILDRATQCPKGSRFRFTSDSKLSQSDANELTKSLKEICNASEVVFKSDVDFAKESAINAGASITAHDDLRSVEVLMRLLKEFYPKQTEDSFWCHVKEQVTNIVSQVGTDETPRNVKWSLDKLEWDNTLAYGSGNSIDFTKLNGVIGIFGPNKSGKSSVIGTVMYSLFNGTDRGSIKNLHVINNNKDHCLTRAVVTVDGTKYLVERQTVKIEKKKTVYAPTQLNVFQTDGDIKEDLAGEQRNDTEKVLRRLIGTAEDFQLTSLSAQDDIKQFITHGSSRRRQIISRFLDLDIFDKMHSLAKEQFNGCKSALKTLPDRDWNALEGEAAARISKIDARLAVICTELSEMKQAANDLRHSLSVYSGKTPVTKEQVEQQKRKLLTLRKSLLDVEASIVTHSAAIEKGTEKAAKIRELQKVHDQQALKKQLEEIRELELALVSLQHANDRERTKLEQAKKLALQVTTVPCGGTYTSCKFIKDACAAKESIDTLQQSSDAAAEKFAEASAAVPSVKKTELTEKLAKLDQINAMLTKLDAEIASAKLLLVKAENQAAKLTGDVADAEALLQKYEEALSNDDNSEIVKIRTSIENAESVIKSLDSERMQLAAEHGRKQGEIEKLRLEKQSRTALLTQMGMFETITTAFSKHGIPSVIAAKQLPIINAEIAKILHGIVDFTVELEFDQDSDATEIYISYGDNRRLIELGCGMEKVIASIAIRVALVNISSLPKTDMFIIDEGFGALDESGVEACNRMLTMLKRYFRIILVITHVEGVKDVADDIIMITREDGCAKVCV